MYFINYNRPILIGKHGKLSNKEFAKLNSEDWKNCVGDARLKFDEMNAKDKERYLKECK